MSLYLHKVITLEEDNFYKPDQMPCSPKILKRALYESLLKPPGSGCHLEIDTASWGGWSLVSAVTRVSILVTALLRMVNNSVMIQQLQQ